MNETAVNETAVNETAGMAEVFLIQPLGSRHRDAFGALVGSVDTDRSAADTFADTLAQQEDGLSVCLVAETRHGDLLGVARARAGAGRVAALDLLIVKSEGVADALVAQLALSLERIGCDQLARVSSAS